MRRALAGREVALAGGRLAFGEPVGEVFDAISQADTRFDAPGGPLLSTSHPYVGGDIFPSPACGGGQGGGTQLVRKISIICPVP